MGEYQMSPEVLRLLRERTISAREAILLMVLDGRMTNEELGEKIGLSGRTIADLLTHLRTVGVLGKGAHGLPEITREPREVTEEPREFTERTRETTELHLSRDFTEERDSPLSDGEGDDVSRTRTGALKPTSPPGPLKGPRGGEKQKQKSHHPRWRAFATQFAKAISISRRVNCTSKIGGWAESFRLLHTQDGIPTLRVRATLKWYCDQWTKGDLNQRNPNRIPVAYGGKTFRDKFLRIEDAMTRMSPQSERKEPKIKVTIIPESEETDQHDREMSPWLYDEDGNLIDLDVDEEE